MSERAYSPGIVTLAPHVMGATIDLQLPDFFSGRPMWLTYLRIYEESLEWSCAATDCGAPKIVICRCREVFDRKG